LIMTGNDLSGSGDALKNLFKDGQLDFELDKEIPVDRLQVLLHNVNLYDFTDGNDYEVMNSYLEKIYTEQLHLGSYGAGSAKHPFPSTDRTICLTMFRCARPRAA